MEFMNECNFFAWRPAIDKCDKWSHNSFQKCLVSIWFTVVESCFSITCFLNFSSQLQLTKLLKHMPSYHFFTGPPTFCSTQKFAPSPNMAKNGCSLSMVLLYAIGKPMEKRFQKVKKMIYTACPAQKLFLGY